VLLMEAGRKDDYHWIHIPVGYLYCIGNPRTDWLYNTEPDAGPERPHACATRAARRWAAAAASTA
jgi:choline dehydrogenase-like flavoprotein